MYVSHCVSLLLPPVMSAPSPALAHTVYGTHTRPLSQVGLRGINGLYLFEIERADGSTIKVVDHDTVLQTGDTLWFAGEALLLGSTLLIDPMSRTAL
jgi:hypothetical protein